MRDHPEIERIQRTGWPVGTPWENRDTAESRLEFVQEHAQAFIHFVKGYDPAILDDFVHCSGWEYRAWLN